MCFTYTKSSNYFRQFGPSNEQEKHTNKQTKFRNFFAQCTIVLEVGEYSRFCFKKKLLVLDSYFYDGSPVLTAVQMAPQGRNWKVLAVNAGSNIIGNKKNKWLCIKSQL